MTSCRLCAASPSTPSCSTWWAPQWSTPTTNRRADDDDDDRAVAQQRRGSNGGDSDDHGGSSSYSSSSSSSLFSSSPASFMEDFMAFQDELEEATAKGVTLPRPLPSPSSGVPFAASEPAWSPASPPPSTTSRMMTPRP